MAIQIRISPDAMRASATRQKSIAQKVYEINDRMGNLSSQLNAAWDGGASVQALGNLAELRDSAKDAAQFLDAGAEKLMNIAQAFEALDDGGTPTIMPFDINNFPLLKAIPGIAIEWILNFSGTVRIVPEEVREVGKELDVTANMVKDVAAQLTKHVKTLESEWDGRACDRYCAEMREDITSLKILASKLDDFAARVIKAANRYEEIDNMF